MTEKSTPKKVYKAPKRRPTTMSPEEFKQARMSLGMSQQELADLAGTGRVSIMRMETGRIRVNGLWRLILKLLKEREDMKRLFNNVGGLEGD